MCDDGIVHEGKEECDDANDDGLDVCVLATCDEGDKSGNGSYGDGSKCVRCTWSAHLIFASSEWFTGDLGGLDGADEERQARTTPLSEHVRAWLSDSDESPLAVGRPLSDQTETYGNCTL